MNKRRETKGNMLDVPTQRPLWHQAERKSFNQDNEGSAADVAMQSSLGSEQQKS